MWILLQSRVWKCFPVDIDQLFVDVFYYFYNSSKRKQDFVTSGVLYLQVSLKQFLSIVLLGGLVYCVVLVGIYQFDGLMFYFRSCSEAETSKVVSILQRLENPFTKPLLLFLSFILPSMDKFNRLFQKLTQNTVVHGNV